MQKNNSVICGYLCIAFIDFMLAGKKLTDYTNLFSPYDFKKSNSVGAIDRTDLSEQAKFQLDKIGKIDNYFIEVINQIKSCSQKLSKYVTSFDYIDKIVLQVLKSFTSIIGAPVGISSASFTLILSQI